MILLEHVGHLLGVLPDGVLVCDTCEVEVDCDEAESE